MPPGTTIRPGGGTTYRPTTPVPGTGRIPGGSATVTITPGRSITRPVSWLPGPGAGRAIATGIVRGGLIGVGIGLTEWAAEKCIHFAPGGGLVLRCGDAEDETPYLPGRRVYLSDYIRANDSASLEDACKRSAKAQSGGDKSTRVGPVKDNQATCYVIEEGGREWNLTRVWQSYFCEGPPAVYADNGRCPVPNGQENGKPLDEETAINLLANGPLPPTIPAGIDIPVTHPVWNPAGPGSDRTKPVVVPVGDPVPRITTAPAPEPLPEMSPVAPKPGTNTGTDAIQWTQPAVEVTHSPTPDQPLRLEVKPVDVPVEGPQAGLKTETEKKPVPTGGGGALRPPGEKPTDEETPDFCEEHPEILACQKLGDPEEPVELKNRIVPLTLKPAAGFSRGGGCPADRTLNVFGSTMTLSWRPICDLAEGVRPVIIAIAAISATAAFLGLARKGGD